MDSRAANLNIRFSFSPNLLGYCGRETAQEKYRNCLRYGRCEGITEELTHFIVLYPYLQTIARITGLSPFSYEVAECYWLGSALLNQVKNEHYSILLEEFAKQGVPQWLIEELRGNPPKRFIPTHLFQVLHIGVGKASGSVPFSLESINNCFPRPGKIMSIEGNKITLEGSSIRIQNDSYELHTTIFSANYSSPFSPHLSVGDITTVHWGVASVKLTQKEYTRYLYWSDTVLRLIQPKSYEK